MQAKHMLEMISLVHLRSLVRRWSRVEKGNLGKKGEGHSVRNGHELSAGNGERHIVKKGRGTVSERERGTKNKYCKLTCMATKRGSRIPHPLWICQMSLVIMSYENHEFAWLFQNCVLPNVTYISLVVLKQNNFSIMFFSILNFQNGICLHLIT